MRFSEKIILILMGVIMACAPVHAEVVDRIIAVVNDDIITLYELNTAFEPYLKNIEMTYQGKDKDAAIRQNQKVLLQRLVEHLLIEQEAKKTGISATVREESVMGVLQDTLTKQKLSMQDFLKNLQAEGSSIEQVKKDIRSQMIRMQLLRREVKDKIVVTDEEIGEYYNKHRDEYEGKESVRIKQLLLPSPAGADKNTKMKIRNEALRLRELIAQGETFDFLVAQYSQGSAAVQGGDLGFIERGTIIPEVESAAFNLAVGQVSDVIESVLGFHIVKAVDKRGAGIKPIAVVREEIKAKIEEEKLEKKYEEWISSLMARSHVEVRP